jgi:hypothetical protein
MILVETAETLAGGPRSRGQERVVALDRQNLGLSRG